MVKRNKIMREKTDSDCLPRKIRKGTCQYIDENGKFCKKKATREISVFEDAEYPGYRWLRVRVCEEHYKGR